MLNKSDAVRGLWKEEKKASSESIEHAKNEALGYLALERQRIVGLSKEDAIKEILKSHKLDNKVKKIQSVSENGLLDVS